MRSNLSNKDSFINCQFTWGKFYMLRACILKALINLFFFKLMSIRFKRLNEFVFLLHNDICLKYFRYEQKTEFPVFNAVYFYNLCWFCLFYFYMIPFVHVAQRHLTCTVLYTMSLMIVFSYGCTSAFW